MPITKPNGSDPGHKIIQITPLHVKGTPSLFFNSIITEFDDVYTPRWTPTNVYGRMDPMSTYGGTDRALTLGFRVISDDRAEAVRNMANIQKLIQYQYPSYTHVSKVPILAAAPYFRFKFLNAVGGARNYLEGYINGAIQINPGFQSKDQAQYFTNDVSQGAFTNSKILFSDVNIVLRIQVLHEGLVGLKTTSATFFDGKGHAAHHPYGIGSATSVTPPPPPLNSPRGGNQAPGVNPTAAVTTGGTIKKGTNIPPNKKAHKGAESKKALAGKLTSKSMMDLASTLSEVFPDDNTYEAVAKEGMALYKQEQKEKQQQSIDEVFKNDGINDF